MISKRGQFYIMAAVIIIGAVIGILAVGNYANPKQKMTKIYDLSKELGLETGNVFDNGVYNQKDTSELIKEWSQRYYDYSTESGFSGSWIFSYGNRKKINVLVFSNSTAGEVSIILGGEKYGIEIPSSEMGEYSFTPKGNNVTILFNNINYDFDLKEGQNFFFVIKSEDNVVSQP